jgi:hypothetical protein
VLTAILLDPVWFEAGQSAGSRPPSRYGSLTEWRPIDINQKCAVGDGARDQERQFPAFFPILSLGSAVSVRLWHGQVWT